MSQTQSNFASKKFVVVLIGKKPWGGGVAAHSCFSFPWIAPKIYVLSIIEA